MEDRFNEQEGLQLIESMIKKAKNNFNESGTLYLVWGVVVLICSLAQFVAVHFFKTHDAYYIWFLTWLVLIYQWYFLSKKSKKEKVKTYTDDILGYVWICFVICFFVMMFILITNKAFTIIYSAILVMYSIPAFLSGIILKVKLLVVGAISCWALAVASVFVPLDYHDLLIAAAVIIAWIIPGMHMRKKYKQQNISYGG